MFKKTSEILFKSFKSPFYLLMSFHVQVSPKVFLGQKWDNATAIYLNELSVQKFEITEPPRNRCIILELISLSGLHFVEFVALDNILSDKLRSFNVNNPALQEFPVLKRVIGVSYFQVQQIIDIALGVLALLRFLLRRRLL
jgi:hypothetical protein